MLERWLRMLAAQWPERGEVRAAEWLAELETLPPGAGAARLHFVLGCVLATLRVQEQPLWTVVRWAGGVLLGAWRYLWPTEAQERAYNVVTLERQVLSRGAPPPRVRDQISPDLYREPSGPSEPEFTPFDLSDLPERER